MLNSPPPTFYRIEGVTNLLLYLSEITLVCFQTYSCLSKLTVVSFQTVTRFNWSITMPLHDYLLIYVKWFHGELTNYEPQIHIFRLYSHLLKPQESAHICSFSGEIWVVSCSHPQQVETWVIVSERVCFGSSSFTPLHFSPQTLSGSLLSYPWWWMRVYGTLSYKLPL